jgi:hypothetical protein
MAMPTLLSVTFQLGAIAADEVTSLPGWTGGALPSKHYSGYIPVGKTSGVPGYIHCAMTRVKRTVMLFTRS